MTNGRKLEIAADLEKEIRKHLEQWKETKSWNSVSCYLENTYLQGQLYMAMTSEVITFGCYLELCEVLDIRNWIEELQDKEVADNE